VQESEVKMNKALCWLSQPLNRASDITELDQLAPSRTNPAESGIIAAGERGRKYLHRELEKVNERSCCPDLFCEIKTACSSFVTAIPS
jgi:hypothetical protein